MKKALVLSIITVFLFTGFVSAEIVRGIDIDFVSIGNAGNPGDTQVMTTDGTTGYGSVGYEYRIGKYEITNAQWNTFISFAGTPSGEPSGAYSASSTYAGDFQPVNEVSWLEVAQFCNYLTSGDKSRGVYQFSGNNSSPGSFLNIDRESAVSIYGIAYVIPTEDEWYKAAYYNGTSYSLYSNGLDTLPSADDGWNYYGGSYGEPWNVGTGEMEQNGTYDMMGNIWEWTETLSEYSDYVRRGGSFFDPGILDSPASYIRIDFQQSEEIYDVGFRVASIVPEPTTLMLLGLGSLLIRKR